MRHARVFALAGLTLAVATVAAYANQTTVVPVPDNAPVETAPLEVDLSKTHWGDAEAGAGLAGTCAACHGADGNPVDPMYPRLAGQGELYIARQLALFASGERHSGLAAVMVPFAQTLSPQDMRDVGAYFAKQKSGAGVADDGEIADGTYAGLKYYQIGEQLFRGGDAGRGIPACMACHGPTGAGNPGPGYPRVGGQHADYTARRLQEYKAGVTSERDPARFGIMAKVARSLTEEEIGALSSYLQGLHPRADDVAAAAEPQS
ncbi:c-type cytochrome [Pseudoxanthomonas suwonensis]|uniref:c-type cytochrome n=1 Tax=Pseudoxanthomonas suwonensis TaxID=314722 RepID=UPI00048FB1E1|nr:c-type cytochrome [Pseudoxanthomonas suwonensis]